MFQRAARHAWTCALAVGFLAMTAAGCTDRYSERRIHIREEHLRDQAGGALLQEKHGEQRLREVPPTVHKWWDQDVDMFNERMRSIGDYVW
jgi:hypothetical protein